MERFHCDNCRRVAPSIVKCKKQGWYLSSNLASSGVPWDVFCPQCRLGGIPKHPSLLKNGEEQTLSQRI